MRPDPQTRLVPSALPFSAAEQAEWDALSDEERLRIFNDLFESPDCNTYVDDSMADILAAAKARLTARCG